MKSLRLFLVLMGLAAVGSCQKESIAEDETEKEVNNATRNLIITNAAAEEGNQENPPNSNRTKYGTWYGLDGAEWSAIFVSWVYNKAGVTLKDIGPPNGFHYPQSAYNHWKENGALTDNPQKGDIVLFDWEDDGHSDHAGIFDSWKSEDKLEFYVWEGDSEVGSSSNGGEVIKQLRSVSAVKTFVSPTVLESQ